MVQFLAGFKGEGKTRKIIDMANQDVKVTDGHTVFIDDDKRHIFDLHRDIRFVEAGKGDLNNYREFLGFIRGIMSQNSDIKHIFVDGLTTILSKGAVTNETLLKLKARLDTLSEDDQVDFTISVHCDRTSLPDEIKAVLI